MTLGLIEAGYSFEEYLDLVHDVTMAGLDHLRRRRSGRRFAPRHDVDAAALRMWQGRLRFQKQHPARAVPDSPVSVLDEVAVAAACHSWGGHGGPAERVVLEVLLTMARRIQSAEVGMAVRSLIGPTGLSRSAAGRALQRLQDNGWLEVSEAPSGDSRGDVPSQAGSSVCREAPNWDTSPGAPRRPPAGTGGDLPPTRRLHRPGPRTPRRTDHGGASTRPVRRT